MENRVVVQLRWLTFALLSPSLAIPLRALCYDWNYLLNPRQALVLIVIAAVWKQISYNFLFFLAGLQSIPKSLIEAAAIDGFFFQAEDGIRDYKVTGVQTCALPI